MNEDGMEAASVTVITNFTDGPSSIKIIPVDFKVNRPFLFFIKEKSTGLIFFSGVMNRIV
jgi:serpin B